HPARVVQPLERLGLAVCEVGLVQVAALLEHDHALPRRGELSRDHAAARAGTDHDDVTLERRVGSDGEWSDRFGRWRWRPERRRVADPLPRRRPVRRVIKGGGEALWRVGWPPLAGELSR